MSREQTDKYTDKTDNVMIEQKKKNEKKQCKQLMCCFRQGERAAKFFCFMVQVSFLSKGTVSGGVRTHMQMRQLLL